MKVEIKLRYCKMKRKKILFFKEGFDVARQKQKEMLNKNDKAN